MKTDSIVRFRNMRVTGDLDQKCKNRISYGETGERLETV